MKRYGDVESPYPWITVTDVQIEKVEKSRQTVLNVYEDADGNEEKKEEEEIEYEEVKHTIVSYWHTTARKSLPRKPDGTMRKTLAE